MIEVYRRACRAYLLQWFNLISCSGRHWFRPYKLPLATLVNRSVIVDRYCMIRLPQFNALSVCLALNRINKFNNIFYQFSKINVAWFPSQRDYYLKCWKLIFRRGKMPSGRGWGGLSVPFRTSGLRESGCSFRRIYSNGCFHPIEARFANWTIKL